MKSCEIVQQTWVKGKTTTLKKGLGAKVKRKKIMQIKSKPSSEVAASERKEKVYKLSTTLHKSRNQFSSIAVHRIEKR